MVTSSPPNGPAAPIITRERRSGRGSLMDMNAPKVPSGGIEGMKNGSEAARRISWPPGNG
jgi:hypothetical protein